jgi:hypothetical protein
MDMRQLQLQVKDRDTDWLQFGQVNARYGGDLVLLIWFSSTTGERQSLRTVGIGSSVMPAA